jgi:hypothetical protein
VGEERIQKGFHPDSGFLCGCTLQQIVGAKHDKENIHILLLRKQPETVRLAGNLLPVDAGIDDLMTGLL